MTFSANFNIVGNGAYANEKISFSDNSEIGAVIASDNLTIDGDVNINDLNLNDYIVTEITKFKWEMGDGHYFYTPTIQHKYEDSGNKIVSLSIWSNKFIYLGKEFYFVYKIPKEITVQSRFYKFFIDNYPIWDNIKNEYLDALFRTCGSFFDNLHKKITNIFDIKNVYNVNPQFFDLMAESYGHDQYYKKVGYSQEISKNINDYDIIDRITLGIASDKEIYVFKKFLSNSLTIFQGKGTPEDIVNFLKLFSINGHPVDLWTLSFGTTTKGINKTIFSNNIKEDTFKFSWDNINIPNISNRKSHIEKNINALTIDSYYKIENYEFTSDLFNKEKIANANSQSNYFELPRYVKEVKYVGDDFYTPIESWLTPTEIQELHNELQVSLNKSELNYESEQDRIIYDTYVIENNIIDNGSCISTVKQKVNKIKDIPSFLIKSINDSSTGEYIELEYDISRNIVDFRTLTTSGNTITVDPSSVALNDYFQYYPYYQLYNFMEFGNSLVNGNEITVTYSIANEKDTSSCLISTKDKIKNFKSKIKLVFKEPNTYTFNKKAVNNQINFMFNIIQKDNDIKEYYQLSVNGRSSYVSLFKVLSINEKIIKQKINLNTEENPIFEKLIILGDNTYELITNNIYELIVENNNDVISAYIVDCSEETTVRNDIKNNIGNNKIIENYNSTIIPLIDNVNINVESKNVISVNENNNIINNVDYTYSSEIGLIGFGSTNSILEVIYFEVENNDYFNDYYTDEQRQLDIKPKYLDWQLNKQIKYTSYDNKTPYFDKFIGNLKNGEFSIDKEYSNSLQSVYTNNIYIDEKAGTRYTLWIDNNWIKENYYNNGIVDKSFINKIVLPLGDNRVVSLLEDTVHGEESYTTDHGVGYFLANNSKTICDYSTIPDDNFSKLIRSGNKLQLSDNISSLINSNKKFGFVGVYEEIQPYSNFFDGLSEKIQLKSGEEFTNKLYTPIYINTACGRRIVGIKFVNCKLIKQLIKEYSTDINSEVPLYGSFTIHVPRYAIENAPNKDFEVSDIYSNYVKFNLVANLGILNDNIKTYSLSKTMMIERGSMLIDLNGLYIKVGQDRVMFDGNQLTIKKNNIFESEYNELLCKYHIDSVIGSYVTVYRDSNIDIEKEGTDFFFDVASRKLLTTVNDKTWWTPKEAYIKRDFDIQVIDIKNDIASNINYFGYDQLEDNCDDQIQKYSKKIFFGKTIGETITDCISSNKPFNALSIKFRDNNKKVSNTVYYAEVTVKVNYSGVDQKDIDILPLNDKNKIVGVNGKDKFKKAPVVSCYKTIIPICTNIIDKDHITYGEYINYAYLDKKENAITFVPYGLMTELLNKMDSIDRTYILQNNTTFEAWNKQFIENLSIDNIFEILPSNICKLYKNYGITNDISLNIGSYIEINHNVSNLEWDVLSTYRTYFNGEREAFFALPNELLDISVWYENVRDITLNNYIIPTENYKVYDEKIVFNNLSSYLIDTESYIKCYLNVFANNIIDTDNFQVDQVESDFNTKNDIDFIPYEGTKTNPFRLSTRVNTEEFLFGNDNTIFNIVDIKGYKALKANINNTKFDINLGKSGSDTIVGEIDTSLSNIKDISKLFVIDENSTIFDLESNVLFDNILDEQGNYKNKTYQYIVRGKSEYDPSSKLTYISEYYFVGIGVYNFDIALGVAKYDIESKTFKKSFLAGYGNYKTKRIKTNEWYKLRVITSNDYIRVVFNEENQSERLVINYNLIKDIAEVNQGNNEELVYQVKELNNLGIHYLLDDITSYTDNQFINNINIELANTIRPNGYLCGFVISNEFTYVTNIKYKISKPINRKLFNVSDVTDLTSIISKIELTYEKVNDVTFVGKCLNGTIVIVADNTLYYYRNNKIVKFIENDVANVIIYENYVIISTKLNNNYNIIITNESFNRDNTIFIKDNNFNVDQIYRYLSFTNRNIKGIFVNNGQITLFLK